MRVLGTAVNLPRALLGGLAMLLLIALVAAGLFSTAAFGAYNPNWEGTTELRGLADERTGETVVLRDTDGYDEVTPTETVAFVLSPTAEYTPSETDRVRRFVAEGGTLVVAEDFRVHSNPLLADIGVETRVNGTPVRDERFYYQAPALPLATNMSANHTLTAGVEQVTLNYGSILRVGRNATVPVRTSAFAYADANRNERLETNETVASFPVVAVESVGAGQVVVLSDPSVFLNAMMDREGNRALAVNLIEDHSTVLFDLSHAGGVPPLAAVVLVLRQAPIALGTVGVVTVVALALWGRKKGRAVSIHLRRRFSVAPTDTNDADEAGPDTEDIVASVTERHPDWEAERVERVAKEVTDRRDDS